MNWNVSIAYTIPSQELPSICYPCCVANVKCPLQILCLSTKSELTALLSKHVEPSLCDSSVENCHWRPSLSFYTPAPPPDGSLVLDSSLWTASHVPASKSSLEWWMPSLLNFQSKANIYSFVLFIVGYFDTAMRNVIYVAPFKCLGQVDVWIIYNVGIKTEFELLNLLPPSLKFWG